MMGSMPPKSSVNLVADATLNHSHSNAQNASNRSMQRLIDRSSGIDHCRNDSDFVASAMIAAGTDSAILGGLLGGSMIGGMIGDMLDGDLGD